MSKLVEHDRLYVMLCTLYKGFTSVARLRGLCIPYKKFKNKFKI